MELLKKLQKCRKSIKSTSLKKEGRNTFSNYDYFTPSQVEKLVFDACEENNIFTKFDLLRTDRGLVGELTVFDLESEESQVFRMATDIPEIKATNIAQQLGGAMTYTERYLKMTAFGIEDNNLDFDANKKKAEKNTDKNENEKPWLNKYTDKSKSTISENYAKVLNAMIDGYTINRVREKYKVSKDVESMLSADLADNERIP